MMWNTELIDKRLRHSGSTGVYAYRGDSGLASRVVSPPLHDGTGLCDPLHDGTGLCDPLHRTGRVGTLGTTEDPLIQALPYS